MIFGPCRDGGDSPRKPMQLGVALFGKLVGHLYGATHDSRASRPGKEPGVAAEVKSQTDIGGILSVVVQIRRFLDCSDLGRSLVIGMATLCQGVCSAHKYFAAMVPALRSGKQTSGWIDIHDHNASGPFKLGSP